MMQLRIGDRRIGADGLMSALIQHTEQPSPDLTGTADDDGAHRFNETLATDLGYNGVQPRLR